MVARWAQSIYAFLSVPALSLSLPLSLSLRLLLRSDSVTPIRHPGYGNPITVSQKSIHRSYHSSLRIVWCVCVCVPDAWLLGLAPFLNPLLPTRFRIDEFMWFIRCRFVPTIPYPSSDTLEISYACKNSFSLSLSLSLLLSLLRLIYNNLAVSPFLLIDKRTSECEKFETIQFAFA